MVMHGCRIGFKVLKTGEVPGRVGMGKGDDDDDDDDDYINCSSPSHYLPIFSLN